jgi:hypothetical protein
LEWVWGVGSHFWAVGAGEVSVPVTKSAEPTALKVGPSAVCVAPDRGVFGEDGVATGETDISRARVGFHAGPDQQKTEQSGRHRTPPTQKPDWLLGGPSVQEGGL